MSNSKVWMVIIAMLVFCSAIAVSQNVIPVDDVNKLPSEIPVDLGTMSPQQALPAQQPADKSVRTLYPVKNDDGTPVISKFWAGSVKDAKVLKSQLHPQRTTGKTWKAPKNRTSPYVKGHLVVGFKQSARGKYSMTVSKDGILKTGMTSIDALNAKYGAKGQKNVHEFLFPAAYTYGLDLHHVFYVDEGLDIEAVAKEYAKDANVQFAEPDYIPFLAAEVSPRYIEQYGGPLTIDGPKQVAGLTPNDPRFDWAPQILQVDRARTVTNGDGTGGTLPDTFLMLDTDPINITHDDLDLNVGATGGTSPTTTTQVDAHGHMCTGHAVAEINNSLCVTGVAGGNNTTRGIMVAYYRYTSSADNATGISWGVNLGAVSIAQASLYFANTQVLENAFKAALDAGAPAYISAGNDRNNESGMYPAYYDCVTAVGGITWNGRHWAWDDTSGSNYGDWVDIVAPGDAHVSLSSVGSNSVAMVEGYGGTSWAAPEVAAIAALCHHTTGLTGTALQNAVLRTANNNDHINATVGTWTIPAGYGGTGIANAYEAVTACNVNASVDFVSINSDKNSYANHGDLYLRSYAEPNYNRVDTLFKDNASGARGVYQTDRTVVPNVTVYPKAMVHNHGIATKAFNVTAGDGAGYTSTKQVSLESGDGQLVTFDSWTPTGTGATTLTVFADLVGDLNHLNDTVKLNLTRALRDTVYMDDGSYDAGYTDLDATWGVKFTPERACTLTAVSFNLMIRKTTGGAPAYYCSLEVWDANGANGKPGSRLYGVNVPLTTVGTTPGWKLFTLPAAQVISKPVYICLQQDGGGKSAGDTTTVAIDYRKASATTYMSMNNGSSWDELGNDLAIRPVVGYQTTNANDIGVAAITKPVAPFAKGYPMTAIATITNFGTATQTNIPVVAHYDSVGGTRVTKITSNKTIASLAAGASTEVVFDPWTPGGSGNTVYAFDVTVRANNSGDAWTGNDSIRTAIDTIRSQVELNAGEGGAAVYGFDGQYSAVKFMAAAACSVQQGGASFYQHNGVVETCFVWSDNNGVPGTRAGWITASAVAYPTWTWATFSGTGIYMPAGTFWLGWYTQTDADGSILSDAQDGGNGRSFSGTTETNMSADGQDYLIHARIKYLSSPNSDLGIESQDNPTGVIYPNFSIVPKATVFNGGRTVLTNPQVTCLLIDSADGSTDYNQTVTIASIAPQQSIQLSFPVFTPQASVVTYWFKTFRVGTDDFSGNDRDSMKVYTSTLTEINYSDGPSSLWIIDGSDGATDTLYRAVRFTPDQPCSLVGMWEFMYRTNTGRAWRACSTFAWHRTNGYKNWPSDRHILQETYTPTFTGNGGWARRNITPTYFDAGQDFWLGAWTPPMVAAQCSIFITTDSRADGRSFLRWNPRDSASNGVNYAWLPMYGDWDISALVKILGGPSLVVKGLVNSVTAETNLHFRTYLTKNLDQVYDETKPGSALSLLTGSQGLWQFDAKNFWPMWNRGDTMVTVVDYEANSGAINHAGSYAVMNDTLMIGVSTQTTNTATLRAIPVPVATKVGSNIQLHWTPPAYDAGKPNINPVIGYRLYRSTNGIAYSAIASKTFYNDTTYTDVGPAGGSTYYYAIKVRYLGSLATKGDPKAVTIESQYTSANSNGILMPLSVEFGQMSAMVRGNDVTINWRTESENDSYQWLIERAEAGSEVYIQVNAQPIPAHTQSSTPTNYSYTDSDVPGNKVFIYRLVEIDRSGSRAYHGQLSVGPLQGRPLVYALGQAMPNPFRGTATISYQLREPGRVSIKIYNISGQLVRTLVNGDQGAKYYSVSWDGTTDRGDKAAAGIYLYKLDVNNFTAMRKLTYLK